MNDSNRPVEATPAPRVAGFEDPESLFMLIPALIPRASADRGQRARLAGGLTETIMPDQLLGRATGVMRLVAAIPASRSHNLGHTTRNRQCARTARRRAQVELGREICSACRVS